MRIQTRLFLAGEAGEAEMGRAVVSEAVVPRGRRAGCSAVEDMVLRA